VKAELRGSRTTALKPLRKTHDTAANSTGNVGNPTHCTVLGKVATRGVTADITHDATSEAGGGEGKEYVTAWLFVSSRSDSFYIQMTEAGRFNAMSTQYDDVAEIQCHKLMPILVPGR
jgi:hypothetical protein